jgi:hypothetical protein
MPTDERRRDDIATAVAAYNSANPLTPLPRNAARLLAVMFPADDVCQRSLLDLAAEGFDKSNLPGVLRRLIATGFLSKEQGSRRVANTYRLHLPPQAQP